MSSASTLLSGQEVAAAILHRTNERAADFTKDAGRQPCLAAVLVGDDTASATYVRMKQNRAARVGITSLGVTLPATATTAEAVDAVVALSRDDTVDGILVQHPMPAQIDE